MSVVVVVVGSVGSSGGGGGECVVEWMAVVCVVMGLGSCGG